VKCPRCQHENPAGVKFCGACGTRLEVLCPACQAANPPTNRFCHECGQVLTVSVEPVQTADATRALGGPQAALCIPAEAERRQLTVMFCDLVGSTALSGKLDPEDMREMLRAYQQACAEVINRFEGHIAQYLGDGLLVYFGYPSAHEDDAPRAVRAALGIADAMERLNVRLRRERDARLAVRVGIHTGLVVVGEIGSGARHEQLALGETPNLAARLQASAEPDTVVISAATHRLIERWFTCRDLGLQPAKGVAMPLRVYRVLNEREAVPRGFEAASTGLTALVGRGQEVGLLLERWEQVKDGFGQVALLSGEAGIGKSRLLRELRERVANEPQIRWECRCSPYHQESALYPVIELFQRALEFARDDQPEDKLRKIEDGLRRHGLSDPEAVSLWAALLSVPLPAASPPLNMTPQRQKQKTLEAVLGLLVALATHQPVLVLVEDLHWIDPSTLELLNVVVEQAPTIRVLVLLTFRPDFRPQWAQRAHVTSLTLSRLTRRQTELMVGRTAGSKGLPVEVVQEVVAKTDGVPLFVEELTRMVLESGLLREQDDRYELTGVLPPLAIPSTLQDSLMARLDRLATVKDVAQLGATLGRSFSYELLQSVSSQDEETLERTLTKLVEAELLYQRGVPPDATYFFKHALIQEAAYQSLLKSRRQQFHQRIALVLAERFPEAAATQPELLAHHYVEAGLHERAIEYWRKAGERAVQRSANLEAIAHLTNGIESLRRLPTTRENILQELDLQTTLGPALIVARGYAAPEVERAYARALQLSRQLSDNTRFLIATLGLYSFSLLRAEVQRARELAEECLALAEKIGDDALLLEAHSALGQTLFYQGEFVVAHAHLREGIAIYDLKRHGAHAFLHGEDPGVGCRVHAAWALWSLGYPDKALALSREAVTLAEQLSHPTTRAYALGFASVIHQLRRETPAARDCAEAMVTLATEQAMPFWLAMGIFRRGWAIADQGQRPEGIAEMHRGLTAWRDTGAQLETTYRLALIADAYVSEDRAEEGPQMLEEALTLAGETGERFWEAELYRLKGEFLLARSRESQAQAEASFRQAVERARHQKAKSLELRALISLSRLLQRQGKREEARRMLGDIYGWFTEGFDTADLHEARGLLDELSAP
jgi:TOMM system kinase/cyclase fusion protein